MNQRQPAWGGIFCAVALGVTACGGGGGGASAPGAELSSAVTATVSPEFVTQATESADLLLAQADAGPSAPPAPAAAAPVLGSCEMFPATAIFNTRIDDPARFPAHPSSAAWIASVGTGTNFHPDWWQGEDPSRRDAYYGIPVNVVDGTPATTDWPVVSYDFSSSGVSSSSGWPHESDCAVSSGGGFAIAGGCSRVDAGQRRFPFPHASSVKNEGGQCNDPNTCGDHHVLVVEQGACRLWESFHAYRLSDRWYALSTASWDLKSLALRPSGWTSSDAAGLPIAPFLAKAAEASAGEIRHALRVTFRSSVLAHDFVWPARHAAGGTAANGIPFGAVLRLKPDFAIPDHWTTQAKAIATAAKRYGMYVSDVGQDLYVQGEPNAAWDEETFRQLKAIPITQMEFVDMGAVTSDPRFSADSMAARW